MDLWVRFNTQSQAKEKLLRAAQYSCTLLAHTLQGREAASHLYTTVRQLEAHLSLTRKVVRLGNSMEALEGAKRAIHLSDSVLRLCITISHLNRALYFACDNVLWAGKVGLAPKLDQNKWSQRSFRYYLFSLILNLVRDLYELNILMENQSQHKATKSSSSPEPDPSTCGLRPRLHQLTTVLYNNPPLLLDLLRNTCDLFIPLDRLGLYSTGSGFVGACGLTSSLLSILTMVHPWLKLKP